jgi:integrase
MTGHGFRSVASTVLNESGLFDFGVKELMGHSTIKMTERYAHLAPEHKASAVEK